MNNQPILTKAQEDELRYNAMVDEQDRRDREYHDACNQSTARPTAIPGK